MEENKQHKTALPETEPIPSAQAPEALLDIRGLRVEYHTDEDVVYAVNGLDLTIGKGESLGLVGETGAGNDRPVDPAADPGPAGKDHGRRDLVRGRGYAPGQARPSAGDPRQQDLGDFPGPYDQPEPGLLRGRSDRGGHPPA